MTSEAAKTRAYGRLGSLWESCRPLVLPVVLIVATLDLFAVWFVGTEQTLYHADQVTYWSYSQNLSRLLLADPVAAMRAVGHSVANNDVNLLPALPVACVMALFGSSRLVYLLSVITIYGAATVAMLMVALRRFGLANPSWIVALVFLLTPTIWRPVFSGYLGIGGVALALAVLALVFPTIGSMASLRNMALAGAVVAALVLFRRWWGIWAVALCAVVVVAVVWALVAARPLSSKKIRDMLKGPLVFGATTGGTMIVFAAPIVVQRLTTDYADRFAAYGLDGWPQRLVATGGHFGLLVAVLVVGSFIFLLGDRVNRRTAVQLALLMVITYTLMVSIQDHSPQHWYLYDPSILLLLGIALDRLQRRWPVKRHAAVWVPLIVVGVLLTAAVFVPGRLESKGLGLFPSDPIHPRVRNDLAEVDRLLTYLDHRYQGGAGAVYVLASSGLLSDHVLGFANLSLGTDHPSVRGIVASAHVDRRDGFPRGLLFADAVVVTDPVQIHLRADEQRVVVEPASSFLNGTDIALAFVKLPVTFSLDGGVQAFIFERVRPTTVEDLEALSARLRRSYPKRPEIFAP